MRTLASALLTASLCAALLPAASADDPKPPPQRYTYENAKFLKQMPPGVSGNAETLTREKFFEELTSGLNPPIKQNSNAAAEFAKLQQFLSDPEALKNLRELRVVDGKLELDLKSGGAETTVIFAVEDKGGDKQEAAVLFKPKGDATAQPQPATLKREGDQWVLKGNTSQLSFGKAPDAPAGVSVTPNPRAVQDAQGPGPSITITGSYGTAWGSDKPKPAESAYYWDNKLLYGYDAGSKSWKPAGYRTAVTIGGKDEHLVFLHGTGARPPTAEQAGSEGLKDKWKSSWALYAMSGDGESRKKVINYADLALNQDAKYLRTAGAGADKKPIQVVDLTGSLHDIKYRQSAAAVGDRNPEAPGLAFRYTEPWGTYGNGNKALNRFVDHAGTEYKEQLVDGKPALVRNAPATVEPPPVKKEEGAPGRGDHPVAKAVDAIWDEALANGWITNAKELLEGLASPRRDAVDSLLQRVAKDGVSEQEFNGLVAALRQPGRFTGDPHTAAEVFKKLAAVQGGNGLTKDRYDAIIKLVGDAKADPNGRIAAAKALPQLAQASGDTGLAFDALLASLRAPGESDDLNGQLAASVIELGRPEALAALMDDAAFRESRAGLPAARQLLLALETRGAALKDSKGGVRQAASLVLGDPKQADWPWRQDVGMITALGGLFGWDMGADIEKGAFDRLAAVARDPSAGKDAQLAALESFGRLTGEGADARKLEAYAEFLAVNASDADLRKRGLTAMAAMGDSSVARLVTTAETGPEALRGDARAALLSLKPQTPEASRALTGYLARFIAADPAGAVNEEKALQALVGTMRPEDLNGVLAAFAGLREQGGKWVAAQSGEDAAKSLARLQLLRKYSGAGLSSQAPSELRDAIVAQLSAPLRDRVADKGVRTAAAESLLALFPNDGSVQSRAVEPLVEELKLRPAEYFTAAAGEARRMLDAGKSVPEILQAIAKLGPRGFDRGMPEPYFGAGEEPTALGAARALGIPRLDAGVAALSNALAHPDARVRLAAADSLAEIGRRDPEVLSRLLVAAVTDPHPDVQQGALLALQKLDPGADSSRATQYAAAPSLFVPDAYKKFQPIKLAGDGSVLLNANEVLSWDSASEFDPRAVRVDWGSRSGRRLPVVVGSDGDGVLDLLSMDRGAGRDHLLDSSMKYTLRLAEKSPLDPRVARTRTLLAESLSRLPEDDPVRLQVMGYYRRLAVDPEDRKRADDGMALFLRGNKETKIAPRFLYSLPDSNDPDLARALEGYVRSDKLPKEARGAAWLKLDQMSRFGDGFNPDLPLVVRDLRARHGQEFALPSWDPAGGRFSWRLQRDDPASIFFPRLASANPFQEPFIPFMRLPRRTLYDQAPLTPGTGLPQFVNPNVQTAWD